MCIVSTIYLLIATITNGALGITMIVLGSKKMYQALILDPFACDPAHVVRAFISLGIILVGMSFVGIVGLITYSEPWIQIYACLMLALAVIQIIVGGIVFHRMKTIRVVLTAGLEEKFHAYAQHKSEVDKLQSTFLCCDLSGEKKWNNLDLPSSCCGRDTGTCASSSAFNSSCTDKVGNLVEEGFYFVSIFCFVLVILETQCVILACCLSDLFILCLRVIMRKKNVPKERPERPPSISRDSSIPEKVRIEGKKEDKKQDKKEGIKEGVKVDKKEDKRVFKKEKKKSLKK